MNVVLRVVLFFEIIWVIWFLMIWNVFEGSIIVSVCRLFEIVVGLVNSL